MQNFLLQSLQVRLLVFLESLVREKMLEPEPLDESDLEEPDLE